MAAIGWREPSSTITMWPAGLGHQRVESECQLLRRRLYAGIRKAVRRVSAALRYSYRNAGEGRDSGASVTNEAPGDQPADSAASTSAAAWCCRRSAQVLRDHARVRRVDTFLFVESCGTSDPHRSRVGFDHAFRARADGPSRRPISCTLLFNVSRFAASAFSLATARRVIVARCRCDPFQLIGDER